VELTRRIAGRRSCQTCGSVYNIYTMPLGSAPRCQKCADQPLLFQRPDDNEETVVQRLRVYEEQTRPLVSYYRDKGLLRVINAQGDVDAITQLLVDALAAKPVKPAARKSAKKAAKKTASKAAKKAAKKAVKKVAKKAAKKAARKSVQKPGKAAKKVARKPVRKKTAARTKTVRKPARKPAKKATKTKQAAKRSAPRRRARR
jgi:adenylate kinase